MYFGHLDAFIMCIICVRQYFLESIRKLLPVCEHHHQYMIVGHTKIFNQRTTTPSHFKQYCRALISALQSFNCSN